MTVIVIPGRKEFETVRTLIMAGFSVTNTRGRCRQLMVATYVPTLNNVVPLHKRPAHSILEWLK